MMSEYGLISNGMYDTVRAPGTVLRSVLCGMRTVLHGRYWPVGVVPVRYHGPWRPDVPLLVITVHPSYVIAVRHRKQRMPLDTINLNLV